MKIHVPGQRVDMSIQSAPMPRSVHMIGVEPAELPWLRELIHLLRHPDPAVPELTRQAMRYLQAAAARHTDPEGGQLDHTG